MPLGLSALIVSSFGAAAGQPIPGDLRIAWRLAVLVLVVDKCHSRRASWNQIHVLSWALLTHMGVDELDRRLSGHTALNDRPIGVDPGVNAAIDLAFGYRLLSRSGTTLSLTDIGRQLLDDIKSWDVLEAERELLASISGQITRGAADNAISSRDFV
jgi:hypothetical protein